ncbi:uncharacterized protein LOC117103444 [Anneissia japonica]|uniref:uncharacterized protein LOC117103444 n=1 Tax=Anneissia japonica TaxID=1529436 RepID=UPI0014258311|nr:uncharacterized protein LOC117103444 [Anneissia japonica]XP_033099896.1 uncharacterized protein LOC117103444 [Anneissia japonica]
MDGGQLLISASADVTRAVSEDNVAARSKRNDKSVKTKKSNRERKKSLSSSKDPSNERPAHDVKTSKTLENLNQNTDAPPGGRRRVRSADSAIFAKKRKRRMVKNQVVGVIEDLENVIYEINSVTSELRGVLNQIDRVTSHLELSVDGLDISEDNIFLKSSKDHKSIQNSKQRSVSCASLATMSRYKQEINASTQTHRKYEPSLTRHRRDVFSSKDKTNASAKELTLYRKGEERKQPKRLDKSSVDLSEDSHSLLYCSQLSLASSVGKFPSNNGSLAASVSSMTGMLSSSINSLNTGYNTSLEEIDFGISWRKRTSPRHSVTADSSYRTLSETNSLYFEDILLQHNNNSFQSLAPVDYNTNNVSACCTCDKEFNILGIERGTESPSLYRPIFSTTNSRRSRSTTASVSDVGSQISCFSSEDLLKDFSADYDRDINTWTTFALVHIDADELGD